MADEPAPVLVIDELSGPQRRIVLAGRALPYRGPGWQTTMRHSISWKAGSPIGTIQPLGSQEEPTTFHGMWKDRFLAPFVGAFGFDFEIRLAEDLCRAMYLLARSGNEIRVEWGSFVRSGLIGHFRAEPERTQDIAWELEFVWNSFDDQKPAPASAQNKPEADLKARLNAMDDTLAFEPPNLAEDFSAGVVSGITNLRDKASSIFDVVRQVNTALATPAQTLGAIATAVSDIQTEAESELVRLLDAPGEFVRSLDRLTDVLSFETWRRTQGRTVHAFRYSSQLTEAGVREEASPGAVGVVLMPAGVTLRALAASIYGTPDAWKLIASANGLSGSDVPAGTPLISPAVPTGKGVRADGDLQTERSGSASGPC